LHDLTAARDPVDLMADAIRAAADDAGPGPKLPESLIEAMDTLWVSQPLTRRYPDPGALVLRRLGTEGVRCRRAVVGGNSPQLLVNEAAAAIGRGDTDVAVIAGGEAMYSRFKARREGVDLPWERSDVPPCPDEVGDAREGTSDFENAHGAAIPIQIYPLLETAVRAKAARSVADHQEAVGRLWARLAAVAAGNPLAWSRETWSPGEITTPAPDNRVVSFPYTKRMCANLQVDQAAAVVLTSYGRARDLGIGDDRLVFPLAGADAHDHFFFTQRWSLAESPAIGAVARAALGAAGIGVDDVARFDLYSCFPSAVEIALDALGLSADDPRPLSLTGGLAFFGGPGNNYVAHSIAEAVAASRSDPGSVSLVTGVGWYVTKHSVGLYSSEPPANGFARVDPAATQAEVDALPRREPTGPYDGEGEIEATAVAHDRDGAPAQGLVALLTRDGRRSLAVTDDAGVMASMTEEAWEGKTARIRPDSGGVNRLLV
jgi:acetyl-CoA C-acetyltransferase